MAGAGGGCVAAAAVAVLLVGGGRERGERKDGLVLGAVLGLRRAHQQEQQEETGSREASR